MVYFPCFRYSSNIKITWLDKLRRFSSATFCNMSLKLWGTLRVTHVRNFFIFSSFLLLTVIRIAFNLCIVNKTNTMTIQEKNMTMTTEQEEQFIAGQIAEARHQLKLAEKAAFSARFEVDRRKAALATLTQAALDYMMGNGLLECNSFRVKRSHRVDVESIDAVPAEYIRTKISQEINKEKIRSEKPQGNWYVMAEFLNVEVK